jgi:dihydrofolate reductase
MNADYLIGINNKLPWNIPDELAHFKRITMGKPVIMGRKTFETIGHPLPGRDNIVITRDDNWQYEGVTVFHTIEDAVIYAKQFIVSSLEPEICIIGGREIFLTSVAIVNNLKITYVDFPIMVTDPKNSYVFFPDMDYSRFQLIEKQLFFAKEMLTQSLVECHYMEYQRIN